MKTNEKKNTSAKKKLIPAVAMLTTSAVMLSTATYAWFTMSREVHRLLKFLWVRLQRAIH